MGFGGGHSTVHLQLTFYVTCRHALSRAVVSRTAGVCLLRGNRSVLTLPTESESFILGLRTTVGIVHVISCLAFLVKCCHVRSR